MIDGDALARAPLQHAWQTRAEPRAPAETGTVPDAVTRLLAHLPPSVSGAGGDVALLRAATEAATVLGPLVSREALASALERALTDSYNPRCAPPWPPAKLAREASRAAARWSAEETTRGVLTRVQATAADRETDWTRPEPPVEWYCEGLGIAPSSRKVTLIGGDPGAGKGPLAGHLAACFALGLPALGRFPVRRCNVGYLDFEGAILSARRIRAHTRGLGRDPAELTGRLILRDTDPDELAGSLHSGPGGLEWLRAWIETHSIEVLIVDSYMSATASLDVDPNSPAFAELARRFGALGIVAILLAHARKLGARRGEAPMLGDVAGSFALAGLAQTAIAVWRPEEDEPLRARLSCMRAPDEPFAALDVEWIRSPDGLTWRAVSAGTRRDNASADRDSRIAFAAKQVLGFLAACDGIPRSLSAIRAHVRAPGGNPGAKDTVRDAVLAMRECGWLYMQAQTRGEVFGLTAQSPAPADVACSAGKLTVA